MVLQGFFDFRDRLIKINPPQSRGLKFIQSYSLQIQLVSYVEKSELNFAVVLSCRRYRRATTLQPSRPYTMCRVYVNGIQVLYPLGLMNIFLLFCLFY